MRRFLTGSAVLSSYSLGNSCSCPRRPGARGTRPIQLPPARTKTSSSTRRRVIRPKPADPKPADGGDAKPADAGGARPVRRRKAEGLARPRGWRGRQGQQGLGEPAVEGRQGLHLGGAAPALPEEEALRAAAAGWHHGQRPVRAPLRGRRGAQLLAVEPHGGRHHGGWLHRQQDLAVHQHPLPGGGAADGEQGVVPRRASTSSTTRSTARSRCSTGPCCTGSRTCRSAAARSRRRSSRGTSRSTSRSTMSPGRATSPSAPASTDRRRTGCRSTSAFGRSSTRTSSSPSNAALVRPSAPSSTTRTRPRTTPIKKVAFNVVFFLGVSFYFPTTFQYTTRR
jgi:hypothetical protein